MRVILVVRAYVDDLSLPRDKPRRLDVEEDHEDVEGILPEQAQ